MKINTMNPASAKTRICAKMKSRSWESTGYEVLNNCLWKLVTTIDLRGYFIWVIDRDSTPMLSSSLIFPNSKLTFWENTEKGQLRPLKFGSRNQDQILMISLLELSLVFNFLSLTLHQMSNATQHILYSIWKLSANDTWISVDVCI